MVLSGLWVSILEQRRVPAANVAGMPTRVRACDELRGELRIAMITDGYTLTTTIAAAPSYDAARGQVQAERRM